MIVEILLAQTNAPMYAGTTLVNTWDVTHAHDKEHKEQHPNTFQKNVKFGSPPYLLAGLGGERGDPFATVLPFLGASSSSSSSSVGVGTGPRNGHLVTTSAKRS